MAERARVSEMRSYVFGLERISQRRYGISTKYTHLASYYAYDGHGSVRALALNHRTVRCRSFCLGLSGGARTRHGIRQPHSFRAAMCRRRLHMPSSN
jgi:hypothetical protein